MCQIIDQKNISLLLKKHLNVLIASCPLSLYIVWSTEEGNGRLTVAIPLTPSFNLIINSGVIFYQFCQEDKTGKPIRLTMFICNTTTLYLGALVMDNIEKVTLR